MRYQLVDSMVLLCLEDSILLGLMFAVCVEEGEYVYVKGYLKHLINTQTTNGKKQNEMTVCLLMFYIWAQLC